MPSPPIAGRHRPVAHFLLTIGLIIAVAFIAARFAPWEFSSGNLILRTQNGMTHDFPTPESGQLVIPQHHQTRGEPQRRTPAEECDPDDR